MIHRVTLDDLFPRAHAHDEPVPGIFKAPNVGRCWICWRDTPWVSISFEANVCSMVCDDLGWSRYWRAEAAAAKREADGEKTCLVCGDQPVDESDGEVCRRCSESFHETAAERF